MGLEKLKSAFSKIKGFGDDLGLDDYDPNGGGIGDITQNTQNQVTFSTQTPTPFQPKGFGDDLGLDDYDLNLPPTPPKTTPNIPKGFGDDLGLDDIKSDKAPSTRITGRDGNVITLDFNTKCEGEG